MSYSYYNNQTPLHHNQGQDEYYDPYSEAQRAPHATYDQGGYQKDQPFNAAEFNKEGHTTHSNLRKYQYEKGNLWTKGGGLRTCGRFVGCFLFTGIWMFVGIVLGLVLYVRPPNVIIGTAELSDSNQLESIANGGIRINADIPINVNNPSYLNVNLAGLDAQIFYPINNTYIGNGTLANTELPSFTNKNFTFPFAIDYTADIDPDQAIIKDILQKCLAGSDLDVNYKLSVDVRVLSVPVKRTISQSASFKCPIDSSSVSGILGGLNLTSIIAGLGA
ncbi:hypothetical protein PENSPDRAFT_329061 [Peniophora sp. CONT]|nr:hypothetical protein PENSPDRAFT_329061 [Peniophora sp. CONT]